MTEESLQVFIEKMGYLINSDGTNEYWYKKAKNLWNAIYKILYQYVNSLLERKIFLKDRFSYSIWGIEGYLSHKVWALEQSEHFDTN